MTVKLTLARSLMGACSGALLLAAAVWSGGANATTLATPNEPSHSPRPGLLAFVRDGAVFTTFGGAFEAPTRLSVPGHVDGPLSWSPDGKRLAVAVTTVNGESHLIVGIPVADLWEDVSPGSTADYDPAWSPDGQTLAFSRAAVADGRGIWLMAADGSAPTMLTSGTFDDRSPTWSPDGLRLAFVRKGHLFRIKSDGTELQQLLADPNFTESQPDWSPDGRSIAFTRQQIEPSPLQLWTVRADGSSPRLEKAFVQMARWLPGRLPSTVLVAQAHDGPRRLSILDIANKFLTTINGGDEGEFPAWSPVQSWLSNRLVIAEVARQ